MRIKPAAFAVIALGGALPQSASAQVLTERNISLQLARVIGDAALAACRMDGYDVTAAVVDRAGDLKFLVRSDSSSPHNADLARRKAYTARTFRITSLEFARRTAGPAEPTPVGRSHRARRRRSDSRRHGTDRRHRHQRRAQPGSRREVRAGRGGCGIEPAEVSHV